MDLQPFPTLILFDVNDPFVNCPPCCDYDIAVRQRHLCGCILVRDYSYRAIGIPSCVDDPNVGQSLLVEKRSVDCCHDFLVHLIGEWYAVVSP